MLKNRLLRVCDVFADGVEGRLRAVGKLKLAQNGADVRFYRLLGDAKIGGDLFVGHPARDVFEYVQLAYC